MRTYGFQEDYYQLARERGVVFVRYEREDPPSVAAAGDRVEVTFRDPILDRLLTVTADSLCLSTGLVADDEAMEDLALIFKLPRTDDGYFLEDHVKLRPVDLPIPGFFVAGTAHGPKTIRDSVAQAQAAASRAQTLLAREVINLGAAVARVDERQMCRLPDLRAGLPLRDSVHQRRRLFGDRSGQVPRLRPLRSRMPGQGDTTPAV